VCPPPGVRGQTRRTVPVVTIANRTPHEAPWFVVFIRRIESGEGEVLRDLRLAALADSSSAFSSLYEEESPRTPAEWAELARRGAAGFERSTFLAFDEDRPVGIIGGYRPDPETRFVELVSMWTLPSVRGQVSESTSLMLCWRGLARAGQKQYAFG
jgi:hypothetical protein